MNRIVAIARLQALGRHDALFWPITILAIAFAVNLVVFASISDTVTDDPVTAALASIYITTLAFGAMAVSQHFPYALGMSVTRREFAAGLGLFVLVQTVAYSVLLVVLQAIENSTNGWGLRLRFFGLGFVDHYAPPVQLLLYAVPMLFMTLLGVAAGAVYVRWRVNGVFTATAALLLLLGGAAALIGVFDRWPAVGHWLTHTSPVALFAGWPLLPVAALAAGSWLALRRAAP
ncbi:ABC transporter permease [Dactylosporangium sp. NPDC051484]|uniref:ABC transporter permease n=1 Tax=Dactylosporangium sp. NPDC051484 TaxID=3154942 RepID=UPI00344CE77E